MRKRLGCPKVTRGFMKKNVEKTPASADPATPTPLSHARKSLRRISFAPDSTVLVAASILLLLVCLRPIRFSRGPAGSSKSDQKT